MNTKLRLNLQNNERGYYSSLMQQVDPQGNEKIGGKEAVQFFKRSGLNIEILKSIWMMACTNGQYLNRDDFYIALKLISYAQNNIEVSLDNIKLNTQSPLPKFNHKEKEESVQPQIEQSNEVVSQLQIGVVNEIDLKQLELPQEQLQKYSQYFNNLNTNNKQFIDFSQALAFFQKSGLPVGVIQQFYTEIKPKQYSSINVTEFAICSHLISLYKQGIQPNFNQINHIKNSIESQYRAPSEQSFHSNQSLNSITTNIPNNLGFDFNQVQMPAVPSNNKLAFDDFHTIPTINQDQAKQTAFIPQQISQPISQPITLQTNSGLNNLDLLDFDKVAKSSPIPQLQQQNEFKFGVSATTDATKYDIFSTIQVEQPKPTLQPTISQSYQQPHEIVHKIPQVQNIPAQKPTHPQIQTQIQPQIQQQKVIKISTPQKEDFKQPYDIQSLQTIESNSNQLQSQMEYVSNELTNFNGVSTDLRSLHSKILEQQKLQLQDIQSMKDSLILLQKKVYDEQQFFENEHRKQNEEQKKVLHHIQEIASDCFSRLNIFREMKASVNLDQTVKELEKIVGQNNKEMLNTLLIISKDKVEESKKIIQMDQKVVNLEKIIQDTRKDQAYIEQQMVTLQQQQSFDQEIKKQLDVLENNLNKHFTNHSSSILALNEKFEKEINTFQTQISQQNIVVQDPIEIPIAKQVIDIQNQQQQFGFIDETPKDHPTWTNNQQNNQFFQNSPQKEVQIIQENQNFTKQQNKIDEFDFQKDEFFENVKQEVNIELDFNQFAQGQNVVWGEFDNNFDENLANSNIKHNEIDSPIKPFGIQDVPKSLDFKNQPIQILNQDQNKIDIPKINNEALNIQDNFGFDFSSSLQSTNPISQIPINNQVLEKQSSTQNTIIQPEPKIKDEFGFGFGVDQDKEQEKKNDKDFKFDFGFTGFGEPTKKEQTGADFSNFGW